MAKSPPVLDVIVTGEHPAALFAAALLRQKGGLSVLHAAGPHETAPDRLVAINPEFFALHKLLKPLRRRLKLTPVRAVQFLGEGGAASEPYRDRSPCAFVTPYRALRSAMERMAAGEGAICTKPKSLEITHADERGLDVMLGGDRLRCRALVVAGELGAASRRVLGLSESWPAEVLRRYTFLRLKGAKWLPAATRATMPMSLDLRGQLTWGWMLPGDGEVQLAVEQPVGDPRGGAEGLDGKTLLRHWAAMLQGKGLLGSGSVPADRVESIDLPLAGALHREPIANRALLIGPAGGFYSACGEDIYPNCWSALFAADVLRKALKEPHLQDALQPYRQKWGATLGDYLRGPQQNLRFLMTLIYRNKQMTARVAEAILKGRSVIR